MTNSKISLAAARVNAGYTQKEVAERLNMDERTIRRWESGKTAPTVDKFIELCRLYNCPATAVKY